MLSNMDEAFNTPYPEAGWSGGIKLLRRLGIIESIRPSAVPPVDSTIPKPLPFSACETALDALRRVIRRKVEARLIDENMVRFGSEVIMGGDNKEQLVPSIRLHAALEEYDEAPEDNTARFLKAISAQEIWEELGGLKPELMSTLAFNPEWLKKQDNQRGRYLEALRLRAKLEPEEAASKIGVPAARLLEYEKGGGFTQNTGLAAGGIKGFIEKIRPHYHTSPQEELQLMRLFLPILDPQTYLKTPYEDRQYELLKAYRYRVGASVTDVEKTFGADVVSAKNFSLWETKGHHLNPSISKISVGALVDGLTPLYGLSRAENRRLTRAFLPALDPAWLKKQPEEEQLGHYLKALRYKGSAYSRDDMRSRTGLGFNYEDGVRLDPIRLPEGKTLKGVIGQFTADYHMDNQEVERLTHLILPALNPRWLQKQPHDERLALLTAAFRQRAGLTLQEVADHLELKLQYVSHWETRGSTALESNTSLKSNLGKIMKLYDLSPDERQLLLYYALPTLCTLPHDADNPLEKHTWLDQQPAKQQAGYMMMAYRQLTGKIRKDLTPLTGSSKDVMGIWERGQGPIPIDAFHKLVKFFKTHPGSAEFFDEAEFIKRYNASRLAFGKTDTVSAVVVEPDEKLDKVLNPNDGRQGHD
jgi:transcriptional regulator with XRE-family HTH domain